MIFMSDVNRMNFIKTLIGATTVPWRWAMVKVVEKALASLGIAESNPGGFAGAWTGSGRPQTVVSPIHGEALATVANVTPQEFDAILAKCHGAWASWKLVPAPKRGEVVKALGDALDRKSVVEGPSV